MRKTISVVGLGKLGLCLSACFAERGFETLGVDVEERVVSSVNKGLSPIEEPGLQELVGRLGGHRLRATLQHREAIEETDITIILVSTPSNVDGSFSNRHIEAALRSLCVFFRESKKYHLFVISSTVMPHSTQEIFIPLIEKHSGKKLNQDFGVCYDPDFVALGEVIKGFLQPEIVVIGESNTEAGERLETLHHQMCLNEPYIARMSLISAEIAKVCLNTYITTKISFANTIANICEQIPNADVDAITQAIGHDKRISPYYFQGGLSFGGTCFPRDTRAFIKMAERHNIDAGIIYAVDRVNKFQDEHLARVVLDEMSRLEGKTVGILGLAFKPGTPVITESPAIKLIQELLKNDLRIVAYDPLAIPTTRAVFSDEIEYVTSAQECLTQSDICVLTYRSEEFRQVIEQYEHTKAISIVDGWRMIDAGKLAKHVHYIPLGRMYANNP